MSSWKRYTMNPENHLFWGQKVKGQGHEAERKYQHEFLHSCECLLLLVHTVIIITAATFGVLFSPPFVCLFVCRITRKIMGV